MKSHHTLAVFLAAFCLICSSAPRIARGENDGGLSAILIPGQDWQLVADNVGFADGASADAAGNFYFSDLRGKPRAIYQISPEGKKTRIAAMGMSGTKIGPEGRLYACGGGKVVAFNLADGKETVLAEHLQPNDIAVDHAGHIYITETGKHQVTLIDAKTGKATAADVGITQPNGIGFSPDQSTLLVSDYGGLNVWAMKVHPDGSLTDKKPVMTMQAPEKKPTVAGGDGMTVDSAGRAYVSTAIGLQIFAPDGALLGVLPKPQKGSLTNAAFAGPKLQYLYITCGNKVYRRKTQATGALAYLPPLEAPAK